MSIHRNARQPFLDFAVMELAIFDCQIAMFYLVTILSSDLISNEDKLIAYVTSKIGPAIVQEAGLFLLTNFFIIGVLRYLNGVFPGQWINRIIEEVLQEIPRAIYFFGGGVTGSLLALATFSYRSVESSELTIGMVVFSLVAAVTTFMYGCTTSYWTSKSARKSSSYGNRY